MLGTLYGAPLLSTAHPCAIFLLFRFIPLHHGAMEILIKSEFPQAMDGLHADNYASD